MERGFGTNDDHLSRSLIPELSSIVAKANESLTTTKPPTSVLTSQSRNPVPTKKSMDASDYMVAFSGLSHSYCIGLVDMVDSTKISAGLHEREWCKYYAIFLNSMAKILQRFGGTAIKNGGDSLLYYFPETKKPERKFGFINTVECGMAMIDAHDLICRTVQKEGLPPLNYRVSSDYGSVVIMDPSSSTAVDIVGPPVNMCSKINHIAVSNGMVIGGDLYEMIRNFEDYVFKLEKGFSIGLKFTYPVYSVHRKENGKTKQY